MDVTGLLSSQQRRPRRNSTSHHHDHNRSASPSPSPSRNHEEEGPAEAAQGQGEEQEQGLEEEERARLERSALEDSRVGEGGEVEGNWDVPCGLNEAARRTLRIEYWDRTRECKERKWDHMDRIDAAYPSREAWIWQSVLHAAEVVLEPNMFPYNTPRGIEHWTLWARRELALPEVEEYVLGWIARERPEVTRWNLDENAQRSIDIYHVHVYFQVRSAWLFVCVFGWWVGWLLLLLCGFSTRSTSDTHKQAGVPRRGGGPYAPPGAAPPGAGDGGAGRAAADAGGGGGGRPRSQAPLPPRRRPAA